MAWIHFSTKVIHFIDFIGLFFPVSVVPMFISISCLFLCVKFYLDAIEVVRPLQSLPAEEFSPRGDRYDGLRACIGESMCGELHKLRVFMVSISQLLLEDEDPLCIDLC